MNEIERLQLQKMIKVNDVEDQTQQIRKLKHSKQLKEDINTFLLLKLNIIQKKYLKNQ